MKTGLLDLPLCTGAQYPPYKFREQNTCARKHPANSVHGALLNLPKSHLQPHPPARITLA